MNDSNTIRNSPVFAKLRGKIIEELAFRGIIEQIGDDGSIPLPQEWYQDAETLQKELLSTLKDIAAEERHGYSTVDQTVRVK